MTALPSPAPDAIPHAWTVDHESPDEFVVRCTECGRESIKDDRGRAHRLADTHAVRCSPTGVTPVSQPDSPSGDQAPEPEGDQPIVMTDGGTPIVDENDQTDDGGGGDRHVDNLTAIIDADILETTIEILATAASESLMRFGQSGLDVILVDPANVYLTELHLDADAFDAIGDGMFPAGINHEALLDYIGTAGDSQLAELAFKADTGRLAIQIEPHNHEFALINPDSIRREPDRLELDHPNRFEIAGDMLQEAIDVAELVSDHVEIQGAPDDECIRFVADGDSDTTATTLDDELEFADVQADAETLLSISYLQDAVGVIPTQATVEIQFADDQPVALEWRYADGHGDVRQTISPRIQTR
jgi:hypothetical protein